MKDHDNEFNTIHTELILKGMMETSVKLNQTQQELDKTKEKLDQTERKLEESRNVNYSVFSILKKYLQGKKDHVPQQLQQSKEIRFHQILPFLSKDQHQKFFKRDVASIINDGDLLKYCQLVEIMKSKNLLRYNYKGIFKWLMETIDVGEIYVNGGDLYFKLLIMNQPKNGEIMITTKTSRKGFEKFKQEHKDTLVFENKCLALDYNENDGHRLLFCPQYLLITKKIWLFDVKNEKDAIYLNDGYTKKVEWNKHVTESNECLFQHIDL